jgi:hypothetical protein
VQLWHFVVVVCFCRSGAYQHCNHEGLLYPYPH